MDAAGSRTTLVALLLLMGAACRPHVADGAPSEAECAVLPRGRLHVRLVLEPDVRQDLRREVESRVASVWRAEGLDIQWMPLAPAAGPTPRTDFWVRITGTTLGRSGRADEPILGLVRFLGGLPHRQLLVSWTAVQDWARQERDRLFRTVFAGTSRTSSLTFGGYDELATSALGYAAAHEVGHFILGSRTHDKEGLMRADLLPRTVASGRPGDLALSSDSRRRLRARLDQGVACLSSPTLP